MNTRKLRLLEDKEDKENNIEEISDDVSDAPDVSDTSNEDDGQMDTNEEPSDSNNDSGTDEQDAEQPQDIMPDIPETKTYKVTYELGNHTNWSRYAADSEDEASEAVEKYISKKYPNRTFKLVDVEEFDESENESLQESASEPVEDAQKGPSSDEYGLTALINTAIQGEFSTIDEYNSLSITARDYGREDIALVVDDICIEENKHVGQLEQLLKELSPNANAIDDGAEEGDEQLSTQISQTIVGEGLEDLSDAEYELFKGAVKKFYNVSPLDFMRMYFSGNGIDVIDVDDFDKLPKNTIELGSTDLSQGTGNLIVYEFMNLDDGKVYRYASY